MRTLEGIAPTAALRRDLRLLWRMAVMLLRYWTVGGRMRREYRKREARGEVYWVDAGGPTRHREEALRHR
jgi:hypothetical protein